MLYISQDEAVHWRILVLQDPESKHDFTVGALVSISMNNPKHAGHRVRCMDVAEDAAIPVYCSCGGHITRPRLTWEHDEETDGPPRD